MNLALKRLVIGAVKSAVSSLTALIIALPVADPTKFSLGSVGGWGHILEVTGFVILVAEARFWNEWANSGNGAAPPPAN